MKLFNPNPPSEVGKQILCQASTKFSHGWTFPEEPAKNSLDFSRDTFRKDEMITRKGLDREKNRVNKQKASCVSKGNRSPRGDSRGNSMDKGKAIKKRKLGRNERNPKKLSRKGPNLKPKERENGSGGSLISVSQ